MKLFILLCYCWLIGSAQAEPNSHATELKITKSLMAIGHNRLDIAMNEVDSVLRNNPNFKLAQVVKGDLLMAKAGTISNFGNASQVSVDQIQDLRDEARVRLQRTQTEPQTQLVPSYIWQLNPQQKFALVVDTSRSTLYVYENIKGKPRYVTDFYVTIGKLGFEKITAGDQRTPIGVYFIQGYLPKKHLADMYGSGAFPLSYPNEWDKRNNRTGSGIWLHGTPSDTYSRPPRASNGCVVLNNDDLKLVAPYLQVGITPVIITNKMIWSGQADQTDRDALLNEIELWRRDWASMNIDAYLKHYAQNFTSENGNLASWSQQKKIVNSSKSWIKVGLSKLSLLNYPSQPGMVVVNFEQNYSSNNSANQVKKRQYWIKQNNQWKIIYEGSA
jgi:murein L,D-transpeptidase YafK